jgi:AcrR family transcriptional regulator
MMEAAVDIRRALEAAGPLPDGRRARSQASRTRIIAAAVDLVAAGDPNPSAAALAERAGVGLRSVFRHFDDKEAIFAAINALLMAAYRPVLEAPYHSAAWPDQLCELIARRCAVNEAAAPFRISAVMRRHASPFIAAQYRRLHAAEKHMLDAVLPAGLQTSTPAGRAILIACSFDSWRLLRQDEELSAEATVIAIKRLVDDILQRAGAQ